MAYTLDNTHLLLVGSSATFRVGAMTVAEPSVEVLALHFLLLEFG